MKIVTWNINGIRSLTKAKQVADRTAAGILDHLDADFVCLQETKLSKDQLGRDVELPTTKHVYDSVFVISRGRSAYAGVTTYFRQEFPCVRASEGLTNLLHKSNPSATVVPTGPDFIAKVSAVLKCDERRLLALDVEGRAVITEHLMASPSPTASERYEHARLFIINVYCPRAIEDEERALFKMQFHYLLQERVRDLQNQHAGNSKVHIIVTGDVNVCHHRIDSCDGSHPDFDAREPRVWFKTFMVSRLTDLGSDDSDDTRLVDTFRQLHPQREKAYTCWSQFTSARQNNYGTRIDYIACTKYSVQHLQDADIMPDVYGSDHCPVYATFSWKSLSDAELQSTNNAEQLPTTSTALLCSRVKYRSQSLLRNYFTAGARKPVEQQGLVSSREQTISDQSRTGDESNSLDPGMGVSTSSLPDENTNTASDDDEITVLEDSRHFSVTQSMPNNPEKRSRSPPSNVTSSVKKKKITDFFPMKRTPILSATMPTATQSPFSPSIATQSIDKILPVVENQSTEVVSKVGQASLPPLGSSNASWQKIFSGPVPPPLCSGHKLPAALRQSRKKGSNFCRYFYCCPKAVSAAGDPNGRCDFFRWQTTHDAANKKTNSTSPTTAATSATPLDGRDKKLPGFMSASQLAGTDEK